MIPLPLLLSTGVAVGLYPTQFFLGLDIESAHWCLKRFPNGAISSAQIIPILKNNSHPRRRQVAASGLLSAGGLGPALGPDSWAGESGLRDAGAACRGGSRGAARLEPALWAPHVWEPAETRLARAQAAGSSSSEGHPGDAGGPRSRGPRGRSAPGSGRSPGAASWRRAAVGLPRGHGSSSSSRGGGRGWAASGCARGAPRPRVTQPRPPPGAGTRPGPAVGS